MPNVRPREVKQLKKLWDNMKQKAKKELARLSRGVMGTSGGPPPKPVDERLSQIEAIVPHITTTAPNAFDSDRPRASADVSNIIASMVQGDARIDESDGAAHFSYPFVMQFAKVYLSAVRKFCSWLCYHNEIILSCEQCNGRHF
ncbi:hypothetical protein V5799_012111 [Amblyomma americanum]|uniref:Uncharacterized protein n=1 Tax=Amblyomma americanum TaxID=6943 RepID=A0AAQ4EF58_AMBAM